MASNVVETSFQQDSVYLGVWTNWSHGSVAGLTFTTTLASGDLFVAFLAIFVTFAGSSLWRMISFVIHQMYSQSTPQTLVYHQQQAILRNSETSTTACWRLAGMLWTWRKHAPTTHLKRTWLPLTMGILTFSGFTVAGIFSSRVGTSRGGEVLLVGNHCATIDPSLSSPQNYGLMQKYMASGIRTSANYASTCYTNVRPVEGCRTFVRPSISFNTTRQVACPFPGEDRICHSLNGAIALDSGFLDSHYDLGINSPLSGRFLYRTVSTCAPILNEGYTHVNSSTVPHTMRFMYGADWKQCSNFTDGCTAEFPFPQPHGPSARYDYSVTYVASRSSTLSSANSP
jgi:hypothetical protein